MIPYSRQSVSEDDIRAVVEVLKSDFLTQGEQVPIFEQKVCQYTGAGYAVAVNSATSGLHIACKALGLGKGDWLWTTPISFVASANCALYCDAEVDFVDIDPATFNLSATALEEKLFAAKHQGRLPKVVVVVHLAGLPCDMEAIHKLSLEYGFAVIEDASHALGGSYQNSKIGSCRFSDITIFSFHPVKQITTGEGGMAVTNDAELAASMALLRSQGVTRDAQQMENSPHGGWYYEQISLGFNYRMTDFQAALGASQLARLDQFVEVRTSLAQRYDQLLSDLPLLAQRQSGDSQSAYHLYLITLENPSPEYRAKVFQQLRDCGIGVNVHYIPIHTQPVYQRLGFKWGDFPAAEAYYKSALSIPLHPRLTEEEQDTVIRALREVLV